MSQIQARQVQCPVILDGYPFNKNIVIQEILQSGTVSVQ